MTDKATHMEARLMGLSKRRSKDGDYFELKLSLHPKDMPSELYGVPLGTRIGVAMVQIADDETEKPVKEKTPFKDLPPSQQAGIRCNDPEFQAWCHAFDPPYFIDRGRTAADFVRSYCNVTSRSRLNEPVPAKNWTALNERFEADTHLPERR